MNESIQSNRNETGKPVKLDNSHQIPVTLDDWCTKNMNPILLKFISNNFIEIGSNGLI